MAEKSHIGIGFDGMCADVSILNIGPHLEAIAGRYPKLAPLTESLKAGRDEELTCEAEGIAPEEFLEILSYLQELPAVTVDVHIGANCALEAVTAARLLEDPHRPVKPVEVDYLGFWSPRTLERVPESIPSEFLTQAEPVSDSEAISLILPHKGKRAILSFGGAPPVRSLSPKLKDYLTNRVPSYLKESAPDMLIVVGTACTFSAAESEDFALLERIIGTAQAQGTKVLVDLGGLGSWKDEALRAYFASLSAADILSMNESELQVYYEKKTGRPPLGVTARECAAMVEAVSGPRQGFLVHTPHFQLAKGIEPQEAVKEALGFAGKAATLRGARGSFPTACEVAQSELPLSDKADLQGLPEGFIAQAGYAAEVTNPVGLGDTWTCSFVLSYLGARAS